MFKTLPWIIIYNNGEDAELINEVAKIFAETIKCRIFLYNDIKDSLDHITIRNYDLLVVLITENRIGQSSPDIHNCINKFKEQSTPVIYLRINEVDYSKIDELFGHIHCIDIPLEKGLSDEDKIKFRNKISVFALKNKDIKNVRECFDIQFFISYRKKDYHFLDKLLDLIYNVSEFRDVAIWYDDYLVPGENYDKNIEHELIKSDLFLLLMTNNLLESGNYVTRIEYPMAIENEKTILAIAFEKLKDELFSECNYKNDYVDHSDEQQINESFEFIRKELSIPELKESPKHLYHIGLAYFLGIGVKKNIHQSIQLIEKAANKGCFEAFYKIGVIYSDGALVKEDQTKAIYWLERFLDNVTFDNLDINFGALKKAELTEKELDAYEYLDTITEVICFLIGYYKESHCCNNEKFLRILKAIRGVIEKRLVFKMLITRYEVVTGYEMIAKEDGTYGLGKEIIKEKYKNTGVLYDQDMRYIIDVISDDFQELLDYQTILHWFKYIIQIHEIVLGHIEAILPNETPHNIKDIKDIKDSIRRKLWLMCNSAGEIAKKNGDDKMWISFKEKRDQYKSIT